jgi:hypothetical protein
MSPCYEVGEKVKAFKLVSFDPYEILTKAAATKGVQLFNRSVAFQDASTATSN